MDNFIGKHFIPLLGTCINSSDSGLMLEALKVAKVLANYYPMDDLVQSLNNTLQHKNGDAAHLALEVIRAKPTENVAIAQSEYKKLLSDAAAPFLSTCFTSHLDDIVLNAMDVANALCKECEFEGALLNPLEKLLLHRNEQIAYLALDMIRGMDTGEDAQVSTTKENLTEKVVSIEEKKYQTQQIGKPSIQMVEEIQNRIINILIKNPRYIKSLKRIELKYSKPRKIEEIQNRIINIFMENPRYVKSLKEIASRYGT